MPSYKRLTQSTFFPKSGSRITASFHNIMWKTAMNLSFPATSICRFRKKWYEGQASKAARVVINESTAASMLDQAPSTADSAVTFTAGYIGIIEVISLSCGDVSAVLKRKNRTAPPLQ